MAVQTNAALPEGTQFAGYRIVKKIAAGGFSIVYLAQDEAGRAVALKEYLPAALVRRGAGELAPQPVAGRETEFHLGLKFFFDEGRALAAIDHPNVVPVLNFFRAHGTVYLVMEHVGGQTLHARVRASRQGWWRRPIGEARLRSLFLAILDGLRMVHSQRLLHLDLKPANIGLREDGQPVLLDFGAARHVFHDRVLNSYPIYTPGFGAPELGVRRARLGPWSDIYSVGATLYACMTGTAPPPATERREADPVAAALEACAAHYSAALRATAAACLQLDPLARPASVFALQQALGTPTP